MCGVILNVVQYLMRMAAYNDARAQAHGLTVDHDDEFAARYDVFAKILAAESIDFGKAPSSLIEQLADGLKALKGGKGE